MTALAGSRISPRRYGVSFSIKQCRNFGVNPQDTLGWLIGQAGFRRFRLMSYWDEIETQPGRYDFSGLDWQLEMIEERGGPSAEVTLCLGARQPRWPENHWPEWAWALPRAKRTAALCKFVEAVVRHYRDHPIIVSYQLENEALLKSFGQRADVDRRRLRREFRLVKRLDPSRPVVMTTSTSWGLPLRQPRPDVVGFSYYHTVYNNRRQAYTRAGHHPWLHRWRGRFSALLGRPAFIHELQLEPWGPQNIWDMTLAEQDKSMSHGDIGRNLARARQTGLRPIDLWGGEWWYWRLVAHRDPSIWNAVRRGLK